MDEVSGKGRHDAAVDDVRSLACRGTRAVRRRRVSRACAEMTGASIVAAMMPSAQKWLPVATTTNTVTAGWSRISQRQRL